MSEESPAANLNFPPAGAARWDPNISYGLPPGRSELKVNGVRLGSSKAEVVNLLGEPRNISFDEPDLGEVWEFRGKDYGYSTRSFCSRVSGWEEGKPLTVCFVNDSVCMVSGGILEVRDQPVAKAGAEIREKVLELGIPEGDERPFPPYYQCLFWEGEDWNVKVESERAIINVSMNEKWWPLEDC